ncbi:ATP-dependent nuclease [Rhizobium jaguaris]|uniref:ATP-binding protein n=1 Tax=Rhizobium jaguaris TaxID=1312183 RepID=A0A387G923_9HYPH|nr:AAA family ATPase [Rhizobium jaguaris]AYG64331.1 hypothetical protein CCGE525_36880 [Rhizobium jaguaris]
MKLRKARIVGFQSFRDSGEIEFSDGTNLIVGQNNAGKSALLRALQPALRDDRHRSPEKWAAAALPVPLVRLDIEISGPELETALIENGQNFIPIPDEHDAVAYMDQLLKSPKMQISVSHRPGLMFSAPYPGHDQFAAGTRQSSAVVNVSDGNLTFQQIYNGQDTTALLVHSLWQKSMFYFDPERLTIGESGFAHAPRLAPNANNLPAVLQTLRGDRGDLFDRLVDYLREIFPTVGNLSVRPKPENGNSEVRVWPTEAMERVELSFPLNQSGTGVAQVIALLTAVMTVENAVVVIDEVNSFLHPAAVKVLLRILQTAYSHHQYIISTHAPEVIGFSNPSTLNVVKRLGYESSVQKLDLKKVGQFREVAEHLGVAMADVFAADRIIWVEGPTEELCFPLLFQHAAGRPLPRGTLVTSVASTGDFFFKRRDRQLVYEIYSRLGSAVTPLVVKSIFSFDTDDLSQADIDKMTEQSRGKMHFLPRRHFECYLVDPGAIKSFLQEKDPENANQIDRAQVEATLQRLADNDFKIPEWKGDIHAEDWLARVDAAKLIDKACTELSQTRVSFNKNRDSLFLLQHICSVHPEAIESLAAYVCNLVGAVS